MAAVQQPKRLGAAARRESILAAALPAFAAAGYERTRVADVAAAVGVTEPVVYQNFGSKPGLFAAVLERAVEEVVQHLAQLGAGPAGVPAKLALFLAPEHQEQLHAAGGLGRLFADAMHAPAPIHEAAWRAHERTIGALSDLLRQGQREGSIREDVEASALAVLLLSQVSSGQFRREHGKRSPILEEAMLGALLAAIAAPRNETTLPGKSRFERPNF
jgi:AcrR family transcriptional regulator